jgi:choline dehydrogenase
MFIYMNYGSADAAAQAAFTTELEDFSPDVIVVGGGSAGAVVGRRLLDSGARVLLLEAGGVDDDPAIHDPARMHELWRSASDWAFETTPQTHAHGRRLSWPRGKVLGGSSCLNAMIWVRGSRTDYDSWAYSGATGWGWEQVAPTFERIERRPAFGEGIVEILTTYDADPIHQAIVEAGQQCGLPLNPDYNAGAQDGISFVQFNIRDGVRHSTARAYLHPVAADANLCVATGAVARRLLFEGTRCTGVEFVQDGVRKRAAAGEVVLAGGAIGSPALLMLSGIGPSEHLASHEIDVIVGLDGVGANLHDHLLAPVICSAEREIGPPAYGLPAVQTHSFARSRPGLVVPDIQPIHFMVPLYEPWMKGPANGFTLMGGMIRPQSRGTIRLTGPTPEHPLAIDPNVMACGADLDSLVAALELCREMARSDALCSWGAAELYPGPRVCSPEDLRDYARASVSTYHHQVGTCKMGTDAMAVVDPELRVYGIEGLRVADASIMPTVTTGNTNAPSIMIGERAAEFLVAAGR